MIFGILLLAALLMTFGVGFMTAGVQIFLADVEAASHDGYKSTMHIVFLNGMIGSVFICSAIYFVGRML